jgi:peptide/nickel transport system substrate-binding protein
METGEFDYAWNLQLAPDVIAQMQAAGKGTPIAGFGPLVERIVINQTNPARPSAPTNARSSSRIPIFQDINVSKAMSMAIDRPLLVEIGYGQAGRVTCNLVPAPERPSTRPPSAATRRTSRAPRRCSKASGWVDTNGDGVREKDGVELRILYQTSTNAVRQDFQALIKQWWEEIGIATELRNIDASVFFGGDPGSPDTFQKFYADVQMYANTFNGTDPQTYLGDETCGKIPSPATQWQGANVSRGCSEAYDALHAELTRTAGLEARGRDRQEAQRHGGRGRPDDPARPPRPALGAFHLARRREAQRLGQRAVERRGLVPHRLMP